MPLKKKNKSNHRDAVSVSSEGLEMINSAITKPAELTARDTVLFNSNTVDKVLVTSTKLSYGFPVSKKHSRHSLRTVLIGPDVNKIGFKAFMDTVSLSEVRFVMAVDNNYYAIQEIGRQAFKGCKNLHSMIFPDEIRKIGSKALLACTGLQVVRLPPSLVSLESEVFRDCDNLPMLVLPWKIQEIKNRCFYQCSSLHTVILPYKLLSLGDGVFKGCAVKTCIFPGQLKKWGREVFAGCHGLQLIVPDHLAESATFHSDMSEGVDNMVLVSYSDFLRGQGFILSDKEKNQDIYPLVLFLYEVLKEGKFFHAQTLVDRFHDHRSLFDRAITHVFPVIDQKQKRHIDLAKRYFSSVFDPFSGFFTVRDRVNLESTNKQMLEARDPQLIAELIRQANLDKSTGKPTPRLR